MKGRRWSWLGAVAGAALIAGTTVLGMGLVREAQDAAPPAPSVRAEAGSVAGAVSRAPGLVEAADRAAAAHQHHHGGDGGWGRNRLEPIRISEDGRVYEFELEVVETEVELVNGVTVTAWAYNGTLPGPEIRVPEGTIVRVHFTNNHYQPHTIHWHGMRSSQASDGVMPVVLPGETYTYEFPAEKPGTHFYHCHFDSYRHLDMGMYGALIVEPREGTAYGADAEYTMILDDWDVNIDPATSPWNPRHNYFLINGRAHPHIPSIDVAPGETVLVRLINAGYQNVPMHLHGTHFDVVASDGNELPAPVRKDTVDVAPGERYDIILRGDREPGSFPFHSHNLRQVTNDGHYPGGIHLMVNFTDS